jgi:hypothetical protein
MPALKTSRETGQAGIAFSIAPCEDRGMNMNDPVEKRQMIARRNRKVRRNN